MPLVPSPTGLSPPLAGFPKTVRLSRHTRLMQSLPRRARRAGLGSSPFARRYLGNRFFFLFLRVLRCFSSPAYLPYVMDWRMDAWSSSMRVAPFGNPRIDGYLLLPEAYRSLSRPSSALSAKASALRPFCFDSHCQIPFEQSTIPTVASVKMVHFLMSSYLTFYAFGIRYMFSFQGALSRERPGNKGRPACLHAWTVLVFRALAVTPMTECACARGAL